MDTFWREVNFEIKYEISINTNTHKYFQTLLEGMEVFSMYI